MKKFLLSAMFGLGYILACSQAPDSIYFNLYTDSLKKGSYNYINVEGVFSGGRVLPLDTTQLVFSSSFGSFHRNSLWIPFDADVEKVDITVRLRSNSSRFIERTVYIKRKDD